ncbi:MAG: dihydropyrimidine dehydrogenase [Haloferacaceae archaeon]
MNARVVAASLSGASDAAWARRAAPHVDLAVLGGLALDRPTRAAARRMVVRGRDEFLTTDPVGFVESQFRALADAPVRPGVNVRAAAADPVAEVARVCARHDAVLEVNAHCRQDEMCAAGAGESLLADVERLRDQVAAAADAGATTSVKVRAEVPGVDLPAVARAVADAGGHALHVDAMDTESVVGDVAAAADLHVVANNGVRDRTTVREYAGYGADAVSVGRPSDDPAVLRRVREAADDLLGGEGGDGDADGDREVPA